MPHALTLARLHAPTLLVLAGPGCDQASGNVGESSRDKKDHLDATKVFRNALGEYVAEQCWVQHTWNALRSRAHVLPPESCRSHPHASTLSLVYAHSQGVLDEKFRTMLGAKYDSYFKS